MTENNLNNSFDSIKPSRSQKERMLKTILLSGKSKKIHTIRYVGMISACAAIFMIAVVFYTYNAVVSDYTEDTSGYKMVSDNTKKDDNKEIDKPGVKSVAERTENTGNTDNDYYSKTEKTISYDSHSDSANLKNNRADSNVNGTYSDDRTAVMNTDAFLYNDFSLFQSESDGISVANEAVEPSSVWRMGTQEKNHDDEKEFSGNKDYSFTEYIKLPEDLKANDNYAEEDSIGKDVTLSYFGNDGRSLSVVQYRNSDLFDLYLDDTSIDKTVLYDNTIILYRDEGIYGGYFVKEGKMYKIVANLLSQSEFENVVISLLQ